LNQIADLSFQDISNLARATQEIADNVVGQASVNQVLANRLVNMDAQIQALKKRVDVLMISGGLGRQNSLYLGDHLALARVLGRFKMYIDTTNLDECAGLLADGWIDLGVTNLIPALLRERMSFVDIGAGQGYYALAAAAAIGPYGHVDALETDPRALVILRRNIQVNGLAEEQGNCVRVRVPPSFDPIEIAASLPEYFDVIRIAAGRDTLRIFDGIKSHLQRNPQAKALLDLGAAPSELKLAGFVCTPVRDSSTFLIERRAA
jgi:hypothetical protein